MKKLHSSRSHITHHLNTRIRNLIRWCTPSIDPTSARIRDPYKRDISVSHQSLGYPSGPSGIFKQAYERAASVYGADRTLFSVNGSTGGNFIVLRALSKQFNGLKILAQRNIHRSVLAACEDYNINLVCLPPEIDSTLQVFLPNKIDDFLDAIKRENPHVLLVTNPTYDGFVLDLQKLVQKVRISFPNLIIFIEEAWGSHLVFSSKLPVSAMQAGADICVQSTHKQGGALQQAGMIHWKKTRVDSALLLDSYRRLTTSSPSYILLASLDAAREMMEKRGASKIEYLLNIANILRSGIATIPGMRVVVPEALKKEHPSVFGMDRTKVLVDVSETDFSGFDLAKILERRHSIIVEKYDERTLLFLTPLQATSRNAKITTRILKEIIGTHKMKKRRKSENFTIPRDGIKVLDFNHATRLKAYAFEEIRLEEASGRISAETITLYPPGIPLTLPGEELTKHAINFYLRARQHPNSYFLASDLSLKTVAVVKDGFLNNILLKFSKSRSMFGEPISAE